MTIDEAQLSERFAFSVSRLARCWRQQLDNRLRSRGISYSKWLTLVYLDRGGEGMLQKDLARFMGIEAPSLVRMLDRLEKLGLVRRRPETRDRRGKAVFLTPQAGEVLAEFNEVASEVRNQLLAGVSDADLAGSLRVFETIMRNAQQLAPGGEGSSEHDIAQSPTPAAVGRGAGG